MTTKEFYKITDEIAPKSLSDEYCQKYGAYDNSGILVDTGMDIRKALFSLDLSKAAIDKAVEHDADVIVTHHPAIYGGVQSICEDDPLGFKLCSCIRQGISVISMHLNLDTVTGGIDESLQNAVLLSTGTQKGGETQIMHPVAKGGYGRAYDVKETDLATLCERLGKTLGSKKTLYYGDGNKKIKRAASFCGAGVDNETLAFAKTQGADVIISADYKHHFITQALEWGMAVIVLTHYAAEEYGFKQYYENVRRQTDVACVYHVDEQLL